MQPEAHPEQPSVRRTGWRRLEHGQALIEYWPTIPIGVAVMISAAMLTGFLKDAFLSTARGLTGIPCAPVAAGPTRAELDGGHTIELTSMVYDETFNTTTVTFTVQSGSKPSISHWVLGIDEDTASRLNAYESFRIVNGERVPFPQETVLPWGLDPTSGRYGIKFDTGYEGGDADGGGKPPRKKTLSLMSSTALYQTYGEIRTIAMTFVGEFPKDHVEVVVTVKAGTEVVSGTVTIPGGSSDAPDGC